ncbi:transcriptional regulator [uncultured Cloacibacillus sp.]|uniref:helix-turn-helix transcriptional regulator n=1 Tax=uncultured Cloacibacillus sp. TaxID=889794 RepID=UPI00261C933F|nr:helix-turn-helix transcriptional regulator [uncultured Cloacibacillus sp.]
MTAAQNMNPKLRILIPVVRGLAKILGKDYEVNLHDVSIPERSLVLCENGYVTGRSEGGPMTDFGLLMLQSEEYQSREGVFNYLAKNNRGELIKCSCIFIRDENDKIIGFLCINYDLKKAVAAQELIEGLLRVEMSGAGVEPAEEPGARFPEPVRESFAQDIDEVVGDSLAQVKRRIGKPFKHLTKPEKKEVVRELHDKGFFLLKGSVDILAAEMGNTKFTIYSYIREIQKKD